MKKQNLAWSGMMAFAALVLCFSSCVNEEYNVEDINTEITLGGESLTLPLGSTKQLKLKSLLSGMSEDMLQVLDGAYALRIHDGMSLGNQLPNMKDMLSIPDVAFEQQITYNLSSFDDESMSIDSQYFDYSVDVASDDLDVDVTAPQVTEKSENATGIWERGKSAREMTIEMNDIELTTKPLFKTPKVDSSVGQIEVGDFPEAVVEPETSLVEVNSQAPHGISNISDVMMTDNAIMEITLSAVNSFLVSGDVIPNMVLDLGGLAVLEDEKETIVLDEQFKLSASNGYVVKKSYHVTKLNVNTSDWDSDGKLVFAKAVSMQGTAGLKDVVVDASALKNYTATGMGLLAEVAFKDMNIKSVMMDVELDPVVERMTIPVTIEEIGLPDGVTRINRVDFTEESIMDMSVVMQNLDIPGLETKLESLKMIFPESMKVEEAIDGVFEVSDVELDGKYTKYLHANEFYLPDPVDGIITYSENVEVEATMTLGGRICSADVPFEKENDGVFVVNAESNFVVDDYYVQIDGISHELDLEPEDFTYSLPSGIADFGTFTIYPEGDPALVVDFYLPDTDPAIQANEDGLVVELPKFIKFKETEYEFDHATNTLYLRGQIPDQVLLPIEKVVVTPVKDEETGGYLAEGQIVISGIFEVAPGEVSGSTIDVLMETQANIIASIPEITAAEVSFDKFEIETSEQFEFTLFKGGDLPEQVKSVSDVVLDDVDIQIDILVSDMPDLGSAPLVDIVIEMPEVVILDETDSRVDGNKVHVIGHVKDGKVDVKPIAVNSIDFSKYDLTSGEDLVATMSVDGSVSVDNPEVAIEDLSGDMTMNIRAAIEDIEIAQVSAVVDYTIDGINESFKLAGLPEFMKGDNFVIDLANPHLILKAKTNMGIPVSGTLDIVPVVGGVDNTEARINATINLPYTESPSQADSVVLWFGAERESCPADYTFVEANITKLIRRIPDELKISLNAKTESDKECVLDLSTEYDLDIDYDFVVPLAFGEDFHIEISDTINASIPLLGQILEKNKLQLAGSISNSLPVQLELNIELLDDDLKAIPMEKPATQKISAGNSDGSAAVSPLDLLLALDKNAINTEVSGFKLTFAVSAPNSSGRPIGEEDFVQVDLKIAVPEGITVDVDGLM